MKYAVAYARFSSDNQREESITAQLRAIREYAAREGITIVREYTDEARSATTDDRPGFLRMMADLKDGVKVDLVLVHKLDRFARNRYDAAVYPGEIQRAGARLVAVAQPLDDSPESVILEAMLEAMAEYYSKNLARETMKGMRETTYQGKHAGGRSPLGYDVDPAAKKYIINEREAQAIRLIYSMTLGRQGYSEIIDTLNGRGYRTRADQPFGKNSVHDILRNEKCSGIYTFNRAGSAHFGRRNNHASKPGDEIFRFPGAGSLPSSPTTTGGGCRPSWP
ncbi:MAG: recombinase family protein [Bacillota bacterium]